MRVNEVEITAKEGREISRDRKDVVDELGLESDLIFPSFEVDVEKLEGLVKRVLWDVAAELDVAVTSGRKRNIRR